MMASNDGPGQALWSAQTNLPYLTAELAGCGGVLKAEIGDFEVEEIPAYEPSGTGEHLFVWLEKRGLDARGLTRHLAAALEVREHDIGVAGLKDARAVTRQYVSVPATCEPRLARIDSAAVRVLRAARHGNKLKTGHLRGNRFRLLLRDVGAEALPHAQAVVERLRQRGVPNYFGLQRFGRDGETLRLGLAQLSGERQRRLGHFLLRLALSSVQSALFNVQLAERVSAGTLGRVLPGEVMQVVASGGPFVADDPDREQARLDAHEIVPAGPMFGPKMRSPKGEALTCEQALLTRFGLAPEAFAHFGKLLRGTRRALTIWPAELSVAAVGAHLEVRLALPKGSYATVAMRELMKDEVAGLEEADGPEEDA